mgnify:CR=1 FL=1
MDFIENSFSLYIFIYIFSKLKNSFNTIINRVQLSYKIINIVNIIFEIDHREIKESAPYTLKYWDALALIILVASLEQETEVVYNPEEQIDIFTIGIVIYTTFHKLSNS